MQSLDKVAKLSNLGTFFRQLAKMLHEEIKGITRLTFVLVKGLMQQFVHHSSIGYCTCRCHSSMQCPSEALHFLSLEDK